jgi:hypothetical protein
MDGSRVEGGAQTEIRARRDETLWKKRETSASCLSIARQHSRQLHVKPSPTRRSSTNLTKNCCPFNRHPLGQTLPLPHQTRHTTTTSKYVSPRSARLHGVLHRPDRHQVRQQWLSELRRVSRDATQRRRGPRLYQRRLRGYDFHGRSGYQLGRQVATPGGICAWHVCRQGRGSGKFFLKKVYCAIC